MAAGCPFVSTDAGGVREISPPNTERYVVDYGDWEQFGDSVVELLVDDDRRRSFASDAREHVTQYNRDAVVDRLVAIVSER
jgi:glycosyltransferase involved in cell wall biosynthesis